MPAVDLSQLPEPAIIAEPDFEAILADTKAMIIASYPAEQREAVSAALKLESEPLNVIAQTMSFREMLLRQRVNEGARACMLSHSAGTDLDNLAGNMNTKRLVITPATDTTDAVMESDTSLRLRAQRAYDGLSVAGPSGAYEYFARSASGLVRDARAISPSPANVTVSILSTEGDGTATEALLNTVRAVLNAEDTRPVADRLTVQSARIVTWRLNAKLYFYPGPESEPILAAAESSFRKWLSEQGLIGQDVALSAIAAALHVHGVQRVEIIEPTQNMAISDIQAARCESFTISEGEFVTIMGTSGSGKSTLLNTLGCLDTPTSGEYYLDGVSVRTMSKSQRAILRNRKIGFVFQNYNLLPKTTAVANVELPLMYNPAVSAAERRKRAVQALIAVGLGDRLEHKSNQMSGGQMQRVAIARALVNDPAVILADEATGNLDTRTSFEILVLFQKLHAEGRTIIFVTHNPDLAQYSSRNIRLRDGHVIEDKVNPEILSAAETLATLPKNDEDDS